jgi:hypothetical protein
MWKRGMSAEVVSQKVLVLGTRRRRSKPRRFLIVRPPEYCTIWVGRGDSMRAVASVSVSERIKHLELGARGVQVHVVVVRRK